MVFSSLVFLCVFLPVVFLGHLLLPGTRAKNVMLLAASLVCYAYGEPVYVFVMMISAFLNYLCALGMSRFRGKRKALLILSVLMNLAFLVVFKYAGFLTETVNALAGTAIPVPQIRLPIGISFFTFQAMSYVIDVYRGVNPPQKNFGKVLLYISFFPQLIAGPIVKYHDVELEIENREQTAEGIAKGIRRFIAGLSKKVLIANVMAVGADALFGMEAGSVGMASAWLGALSYLLQIYFDFSGYSDMAIGLGWMFGFHFKENFHYPYSSCNIREFWRRWHISLSSWFQEYLYIPLGGNRKGKVRTCINKFFVFLCTGIWHGANVTFLFWGVYHGCFLMLEEFMPWLHEKGGKVKQAFLHVYTILVVCIGFVFFRADTMKQGILWVKNMFTGLPEGNFSLSLCLQQLTPLYIVTFAAACLASFPVCETWKRWKGYETFAYVCSMAGLVLCMLNLAGGSYNPFIYFRF